MNYKVILPAMHGTGDTAGESRALAGRAAGFQLHPGRAAGAASQGAAGDLRGRMEGAGDAGGRRSTIATGAYSKVGDAAGRVTIGCNIPVFRAGHEKPVAFARPHPGFERRNLFAPDDVPGRPPKPLCGKKHQDDWIRDHAINSGQGLPQRALERWNPASRVAYCEDSNVSARVRAAPAPRLKPPAAAQPAEAVPPRRSRGPRARQEAARKPGAMQRRHRP